MRKIWLVLSGLAILTLGCSHPGVYWQNRALDFADCFRGEVGTGYGLDVQVGATDWFTTGLGASSTLMAGFVGRQPVGPEHHNNCDMHLGFPAWQFRPIVLWFSGVKLNWRLWERLGGWGLLIPLIDGQIRNANGDLYGDIFNLWAMDPMEEDILCAPPSRFAVSVFGVNQIALFEEDRGRFRGATWPHGPENDRGRFRRPPGPKLVDAFEFDLGATLVVVSARVGFSFGQFADFALGFFGLDIAGDDGE